MWFIQNTLKNFRKDTASHIEELIIQNTQNLVVASGGIFLILLFLSANDMWLNPQGFWIVFLTAFLFICGSYLLVERKVRLAQGIWIAGCALTITLTAHFFDLPEALVSLSLLPLFAVILINGTAGLFIELLLVGLFFLPWPFEGMDRSTTLRGTTIACGAICLFLGWSILRTFRTVTLWSVNSYKEARENLEEVRRHRAELAVTKKDLAMIAYRLERANVSLVAAWRAAEEARRAKTEFVTTVSHELRTPLNLITGFSEVMLTSPANYGGVPLPPAYRADMNVLYQSSMHLLELVDDVIDMERLEAQKITLSPERSDIGVIITEASNLMADLIHAKGLDLRVRITPNLPPVWVDRLRIRQVLLNLLVNAVRFTSKGSIEIQVNSDGKRIKTAVIDTGKGISLEEQSSVFEEFHSQDQPRTKWHSGSGLGLPISKRLIELHNGEMGIESELGAGTTFWFTLPITDQPVGRSELRLDGDITIAEELSARQRLIVCVHPDRAVIELIQKNLGGYRILGSQTIEEGLQIAQESRALALLSSVEIPAQVEGDFLTIYLPIISPKQFAQHVGANDLLIKPVSMEQLVQTIMFVEEPIRNVLIADDDPDIVALFHRILQSSLSDSHFDEAYTGLEAFEKASAGQPELILIDQKMPDLNGLEVIQKIREIPGAYSPYIILISGELQIQETAHVLGGVWLNRAGGFPTAQLLRSLDIVIKSLSPGWFE